MNQAPDNPLVGLGFEIPFDRILPEHIEPAVEHLLRDAEAALDDIRAQEGTPTWDSTLGALERATEPLSRAWSVVEHLRSVQHSDALTEAHTTVLPRVSAFFSSISLDGALFASIRAYAETPEAAALDAAARRHLERTLDDFRRHGAELAPEAKERFAAIASELAELGSRFGTHVVKATADWDLVIADEDRLAGLPPSALAMAAAAAEQAGVEGWRFTLAAPSVQSVLTYLDDDAIREQVWRAHRSRCHEGELSNGPVIERILALRREQAELLGHDDFADYVLAPRMAKTGEAAEAFLADLEARSRPAFEAERAELAAFAADHLDRPMKPWDVSWLSEKLRKARYDLDEEELRPYFAFPRVLQGVFDLVHRLYGVTVRPTELPTWHDTVDAYEVMDEDGTRIGAFYVDFVPRPEKRQGAWMNALVTGGPTSDGGFAPHLGLICGNVTPPHGDVPALLSHREVETVFHEFGHLMHHLLSTVAIKGQAGTNVAWDFVELPSQIMENWCWEREALDLFAHHHATDATIPDSLFERMTAARTFMQGTFFVRQLGFGRTDLALHRGWTPDEGDVLAWSEEILARYAVAEGPPGHGILPTFLHLFAHPVGYAAGYYSYMWAAVLDADAFSRFQREGLFSRETGQAFRDAVLARGDSADPAELFREFMGRDPDPEALLRRSGLAA